MKKLFLFIGLLIFTVNSFSQYPYNIDEKPYTDVVDNAVDFLASKNYSTDEFLSRSLTFKVNNTLYAISYEDTTYIKYTRIYNENGQHLFTNWAKTRYVFLYRKDPNGWVIASDTIQTDYYNTVYIGLNSKTNLYDNAYPYSVILNYTNTSGLDAGYGSVRQLKNGCVFMLIPTTFGDYKDVIPYSYNKVVIFIPKGDGTYSISKFEPINKNNIQPDLYSNMNKLDITENGNELKVDIWIHAKLVGNEKPDGVVTLQSERREVKIPYKTKLFCSMNFEILNGKAYYSGDYILAQTR